MLVCINVPLFPYSVLAAEDKKIDGIIKNIPGRQRLSVIGESMTINALTLDGAARRDNETRSR